VASELDSALPIFYLVSEGTKMLPLVFRGGEAIVGKCSEGFKGTLTGGCDRAPGLPCSMAGTEE
jgi:hypothetical protein